MPGAVPEGYSEKLIADHCKKINAVQTEYSDRWVKLAKPFFAERVPATASKKVVYPFSGGDLSTALTVYPDADEITTMSLEPAGDPRTLQALNDAATKPIGKATKPSPQAKQALVKLGRESAAASGAIFVGLQKSWRDIELAVSQAAKLFRVKA